MSRQLLIFILYFFGQSEFSLAKVPNDSTLVMPSPQNEKVEKKKEEPDAGLTEREGLLTPAGVVPAYHPPPTYHLKPGPSLTLALSRAYEVESEDHMGWIGAHVAPWMTATLRTQIGLDIRDNYGWLQFALHSLPTRNLYRLYWGGGVSVIMDSREELRPFLRLRNYHAFVVGGSELQLLEKQNIRFELSYHQGSDTGFAKATLGYTFLFN